MAAFQRLFKQTFIYGLATVLPRMFSFLLVPLYTELLPTAEYGQISIIFSYFIIFNVVLSYGMETAFFRFYTNSSQTKGAQEENERKKRVLSTSSWSLVFSSFLFFIVAFMAKTYLAQVSGINESFITFVLWILLLDALAIIPFAYLRAKGKPMRYAVIKILNVAINLFFNIIFLLYLGDWAAHSPFLQQIYIPNFEINYVLIANVIASGVTLLFMLPFYSKLRFSFDTGLWKKMLRYSFPVLIAGVAFAINTALDKILLDYMLPESIAASEIGAYAACYKLAVFMTLFATAFRLGIEPFFFSHASAKNAKETYAGITHYFVIFGAIILVVVIVFIDLLKVVVIQNPAYWAAMSVVPLILLANLFLGIYHNLSVWYKITDRTKFGAWISAFGAFVTIALNLALIPFFGYLGSAIALLSACGSMVLLSYYFGQKYYPVPYDLKKIMVYLGLSIGFSVLSFYVFRGNYFIGVSLLLLFLGVVILFEKEQFKQLIKNKS